MPTKRRRRSAPKRDYWHKQHFTITVPIFGVNVGVFVNPTEAEIHKKMARWSFAHTDEFKQSVAGWDARPSVVGRVFPFGGGFVMLLRFSKNNFRKDMGTLVHELTHIVHYILNFRHVKLTEETEEVYAYLLGWIAEAAMRKLWP